MNEYGVYRHPVFEEAINEYFDITDTKTRKILLAVDEADQNQILTTLTSKLYDAVVSKVDDIDFGDIPRTKGDITKLPNYDKIVNCLDILEKILVQYKQKTDPVDTISNALENLRIRKEVFMKAYRYNVELPIVVYNTIGLSIISSISLMIATTIEFIKNPGNDSYEIVLDSVALAKTKDNLLFTNLKKFNKSCEGSNFDNAIDTVIKNNMKNFTGAEIGFLGAGIAIVGIILTIVPIMRELIFFFYYSRTRVSEYFDIQADLLQMNAHNLELSSTNDGKEKEKIAKKQLRIADVFRKISNAIAVSNKNSEVAATKEITANDKKLKTDDVLDSVPDSASSVLF